LLHRRFSTSVSRSLWALRPLSPLLLLWLHGPFSLSLPWNYRLFFCLELFVSSFLYLEFVYQPLRHLPLSRHYAKQHLYTRHREFLSVEACAAGYALTDCLTAKLLLALASTVILGSESHRTHDRILLSDGSGSLQTLLLIGYALFSSVLAVYPQHGPHRKHRFQQCLS
jgi:hypothetical protein